MGTAFSVQPYSVEALVSFLAECSGTNPASLAKKTHCAYFREYFGALKAATIVVEREYIDHDYLDDYAAYYVRCFQEYARRTFRLHFFSESFDGEAFGNLLTGAGEALSLSSLQDTYLGFVVVKPLPGATIGRTCLKTYPDDGGRRHYPLLRTYDVSLFGLPLQVESLAFQEQDTVVAACATSALWTCFQGTGKLFQHAIPSPVDITQAATQHLPDKPELTGARRLPNAGLTTTQMAFAVRAVTLEPHLTRVPDHYVLSSTLYAYLRGGIPSILLFWLVDTAGEKPERLGPHAVAVTGYSLGYSQPTPHAKNGFLLRAGRMDKLYVHDDRVGPFARMPLADTGRLATSFNLPRKKLEAEPELVLVPLYHKIRIPFDLIHDFILSFDGVVEWARQHFGATLPRLEWDIHLVKVSDYKQDLRTRYHEKFGTQLEALLTESLPKYLWRASAFVDQEVVLDMVFDATGIAQHDLLLQIFSLNDDLAGMLKLAAPAWLVDEDDGQLKSMLQRFADA